MLFLRGWTSGLFFVARRHVAESGLGWVLFLFLLLLFLLFVVVVVVVVVVAVRAPGSRSRSRSRSGVGVGVGLGLGVGIGLGVVFGWTGWCPPVQMKNTFTPQGCYLGSNVMNYIFPPKGFRNSCQELRMGVNPPFLVLDMNSTPCHSDGTPGAHHSIDKLLPWWGPCPWFQFYRGPTPYQNHFKIVHARVRSDIRKGISLFCHEYPGI